MSFAKSKVTRFNEVKGCAPGVGSYDVKAEKKVIGTAMVEKSKRFYEMKDNAASGEAVDQSLSSASSLGDLRTPNKANLSMAHRKNLHSASTPATKAENGKIKELEAKVKHLILHENEMEKRLQQSQEKMERLDARLKEAMKEKGQLQANLAKSDRQVQDLTRAKEVLRNKVESLENSNTRHHSTSEELEATRLQLRKKEKELDTIETELIKRVQSLQADLNAAQDTIKALKETKEAIDYEDRYPAFQ